MASKKIKPVTRIVKIEAEINRIAEEVFFDGNEVLGLDESWIPLVDITESPDRIIVKAEVPGVDQKDIIILLFSSRIEIKGVKREHQGFKSIRYHRLERQYGNFRRFVFLPCSVRPEGAQAMLENGELTIYLNKMKREREKEIVVKIKKTEQ
ncbi:MAG: Hsp20/alpha crystallin family protein [Candidatus Aminicenantes bacterium]|nr:Hsp20/alpha crystallin family protein [Candidatus Aminicenantes bacterium]